MTRRTVPGFLVLFLSQAPAHQSAKIVELRSDLAGQEIRLSVKGLAPPQSLSAPNVELGPDSYTITTPARLILPSTGLVAITIQVDRGGPGYHAIIPAPVGAVRLEGWGHTLILRRSPGSERLEMSGMERGRAVQQ